MGPLTSLSESKDNLPAAALGNLEYSGCYYAQAIRSTQHLNRPFAKSHCIALLVLSRTGMHRCSCNNDVT